MVYLLSIETTTEVFTEGYHLGTDEALARQECEVRYNGRVKFGLPTVGVALLKTTGRGIGQNELVDVYDGRWASVYLNEFTEE